MQGSGALKDYPVVARLEKATNFKGKAKAIFKTGLQSKPLDFSN